MDSVFSIFEITRPSIYGRVMTPFLVETGAVAFNTKKAAIDFIKEATVKFIDDPEKELEIVETVVFNTGSEIEAILDAATRETALSKLTENEKRVLGL